MLTREAWFISFSPNRWLGVPRRRSREHACLHSYGKTKWMCTKDISVAGSCKFIAELFESNRSFPFTTDRKGAVAQACEKRGRWRATMLGMPAEDVQDPNARALFSSRLSRPRQKASRRLTSSTHLVR